MKPVSLEAFEEAWKKVNSLSPAKGKSSFYSKVIVDSWDELFSRRRK